MSFVKRKTIWNAVGGGFSNPGQSKVFRIGKHKVLVTRSEKLNRNGNPIHTATYIRRDGSIGASYRSDGSASLVVSKVLKKHGIDTKY